MTVSTIARPQGHPELPETAPPHDEQATPVVKRWARSARCVGQARSELRGALGAWGLEALSDSAELVLSELLTNSVRHARTPRDRHIETRFLRTDGGVRIEVHDADETWPQAKEPSQDDESGRGLALVDLLTGGRWGAGPRGGVGKLTWALVTEGPGC